LQGVCHAHRPQGWAPTKRHLLHRAQDFKGPDQQWDAHGMCPWLGRVLFGPYCTADKGACGPFFRQQGWLLGAQTATWLSHWSTLWPVRNPREIQ